MDWPVVHRLISPSSASSSCRNRRVEVRGYGGARGMFEKTSLQLFFAFILSLKYRYILIYFIRKFRFFKSHVHVFKDKCSKETSALKISFQRISFGDKYMYNLI